MSEKGTYSDPRCYACMPADEAMGVTATVTVTHYRTSGREPDIDNAMVITENPEGWREVDGVQLPPITWAEKEAEIERHFPHWSEGKKAEARASLGPKPYHTGRYGRVMNSIADVINACIPGPKINNDVLRNARSE